MIGQLKVLMIHSSAMQALGNTIFILIFLVAGSSHLHGQGERIMTFNIRFANPGDGINQWENRKESVVNFLQYYQPMIFGVQEALISQLEFMDQHLSDYSRIGVGRDDGAEKGEFSAIYYDHTKVKLLDGTTFWLSEEDSIVSVGWDASMERICTVGLFEGLENQQQILVLNTHYDHIGEEARAESSKLILQKIRELNPGDSPVVLMGDFNSEPHDEPIRILTEELQDAAFTTDNYIYGPVGTFTGFTENVIPTRRIDYIFVKSLTVRSYRHIDDRMPNNHYLSDHLPVMIEFSW